jgi:hypothetical protein
VDPGVYTFDGRLRRNTAAISLATNSAESQRRLKAGLSRLAERLVDRRDAYTSRGWKNVALDAAEVRASGTRDDRFGAEKVIDNKTWEIPVDGVVDYTLGTITTTGNGGYGRGATPYDQNLSTWPLFFRPTYWLLPPRTPGEITITLKEPTKVKLVRLLNTTNAGLNDFATVRCRLELLSREQETLWSKEVTFGRAWDDAFKASFAIPEFFSAYGDSFQGILEPGVIVPFGAGWQDVFVDLDREVRYVRVRVDEFWAMGGGLNEIQVYAE